MSYLLICENGAYSSWMVHILGLYSTVEMAKAAMQEISNSHYSYTEWGVAPDGVWKRKNITRSVSDAEEWYIAPIVENEEFGGYNEYDDASYVVPVGG